MELADRIIHVLKGADAPMGIPALLRHPIIRRYTKCRVELQHSLRFLMLTERSIETQGGGFVVR